MKSFADDTTMINRILQPHSILVTLMIFAIIWLVDALRLNMHYLDPFNNGLQDYETTDIVYAYLSERPRFVEPNILLVNTGLNPDRSDVTKLINCLTEAEPAAIGLDIFFETTDSSKVDRALQTALQTAPNVVLACQLQPAIEGQPGFSGWMGVDSFFAKAASVGYVNFPSNNTKTIRMFRSRESAGGQTIPAFATALAEYYDPERVQLLDERNRILEQIYYIGERTDFIRTEMNVLLNAQSVESLRQAVAGKIVLVGYVPEESEAEVSIADRHYTPLNPNYTGKAIPDMFGLVVHANVISMIINGHYVKTPPAWLRFLLTLLFSYFNVVLIHWIYRRFHESFHGITRALQGIEFVFLFFLIALLFYYWRIDFEFPFGIFALLLAYDVIMIYENFLRQRIPWLEQLPAYLAWHQLTPKRKANKTQKDDIKIESASESNA